MLSINIMGFESNSIMSLMGPMTLMSSGGTSISKVCMMVFFAFLSILSEFIMRNHHHINLSRLLRFKKTQYKIQCNIVYKHNSFYESTISLPYKAVMSFLYQKILKDSQTKLKYHIIDEISNYSLTPIKLVVFDNPRAKYFLNEYIQISHTEFEDKSEKGEFTYKTYTIEINSIRNDLHDVMSFLKDAISQYDEHQENSVSDGNNIYILNGFEENTNTPSYEEVSFQTTKTFDNMFFAQKEELMQRIKDFEESQDRYTRLGIPYTLGLMFHGKPGTGKTSAIKAIARYTQRHIVIIPVKKVNNADKLKKIFMTERINDVKVPIKKRLYVFEEIDCSQWRSVVMSRRFQVAVDCTPCDGDTNLVIAKEIASALKDMKKNEVTVLKDKESSEKFDLTLGDLLDVLDGMIEMSGRMMVMTSNHPDIIDTALLRPGRIDMTVEFKEMTRDDIANMYRLWFDQDIPDDVLRTVKDSTFTQADIGNIFSHRTKEDIFNVICT